MNKRDLEILVTNDDGYSAKGINTLANLLLKYGNVTVIAPEKAQSGMSVALSLAYKVRLHKISEREENGRRLRIYALTGTPADCVKMAMNSFFSIDNKPDLLVSGINHGSNASAASIYSGTLGAATEGSIYGIPSVGLSLSTDLKDPDFSHIGPYIEKVIENTIACPPKKGVYLNVNFPYVKREEIKGFKFAKQGMGMWIKEFHPSMEEGEEELYYMTGEFLDTDSSDNADHKVVSRGYISVVPHNIDTTDYGEMERLKQMWNL